MIRVAGMVRVVVFDLGDTLVGATGPFPHVIETLTALRRVRLTDGGKLTMLLVSDFVDIPPPVTKSKIAAARREYGALLHRMGLQTYFRPMTTRVTLSSDLGIRKPDRRLYQLALDRSGTHATFADCLVITENAAHISACRQLGMSTLHFGVDFTDWADAAELITRRIGGVATTPPTRARVSQRTSRSSASSDEAAFERSLREHGQISDTDEMTPGTTHVVEPGAEQPVRRRYSAI
jgi:beta-phosphoglucomutase-like phosphatase (HAD superfamily)